MTTGIQVSKIQPYTKGGNLKAFVTVQLGGVTIHDIRVIQQPGQEAWISMPQKEVPQPDGTKKYFPLVKLNENLEKQVGEAVKQAWANFNKQTQAAPPANGNDIPF